MRKTIRINYIIAAVFALFVFVVSFANTGGAGFNAFAAETVYSDVLSDLQKDDNFNVSDYPEKLKDYSLKVIQIAESADGELFVYVYQPSGETAALRATTVRISTETGDELKPHDYKLTYINFNKTLYKYKVEGLTVKDEPVRYYDIAAIHRKWHRLFDSPAEGDNTINEVAFEVGQRWRVSTDENGETVYEMVQSETIEIIDKFVGFLKYSNGFKLTKESCISHFVAFTADRPIDTLYEAEVSFIYRSYCYAELFTSEVLRSDGEWQDDVVTVTYKEAVKNETTGLFGKKYTWDRIERASDFSKKEDLSDEAKTALENKQWVLRFKETDMTTSWNVWWVGKYCYYQEIGTEISEVTILRLKFETDGVSYNLGVVDNKQTGGRTPSNKQPGIPSWVWIVVAVVAVILILILLIVAKVFGFLDIIVKIFKGIFTALWWVISLPFRLIAKLIKRKRETEPAPPKKTSSNKSRSKTTTRKKTAPKKAGKKK